MSNKNNRVLEKYHFIILIVVHREPQGQLVWLSKNNWQLIM